MEMEKINYMLEIDILRNSSQNFLGVLMGAFQGFGCPKRHPDALLAKTMALNVTCPPWSFQMPSQPSDENLNLVLESSPGGQLLHCRSKNLYLDIMVDLYYKSNDNNLYLKRVTQSNGKDIFVRPSSMFTSSRRAPGSLSSGVQLLLGIETWRKVEMVHIWLLCISQGIAKHLKLVSQNWQS